MELQSTQALKQIPEIASSNTEIETCLIHADGSTQPGSTRSPAMHSDAVSNTAAFPLPLLVLKLMSS
jgi:hypothetical protein